MKFIFTLLFFFISSFLYSDVEDNLRVFEGSLQNKTFTTVQNRTVHFVDNEMSVELFTNPNQKVRIQCIMYDKFCDLTGYELSPFRDARNLEDWTIKKIPKYVYGNWASFNPVVAPDGKNLYWTAVKDIKKLYLQKIFSSKMTKNQFWQKGEKFSKTLNNRFSSAILSVLPSEKELFVFGNYGEKNLMNQLNNLFFKERRRLLRYEKNEISLKKKLNRLSDLYTIRQNEIYNRVPLYISKKKDGKWSTPDIIPFKNYYNKYKIKDQNGEQIIFGGATLSTTGNTLIYSAKHNNSKGKLDLYVSRKNDKGNFPIGTSLGSVNTKDEDTAPFLASDNKTLYFASNRNNITQLYVTQKIDDSWQNWTYPRKVSEKLEGVTFFSIPAKGNWAYASRNNELIMIYLPRSFRPNPTLIIQGAVKNNKNEPLKSRIYYQSFQDKAHRGYLQTDKNGDYAITIPYGQRYDFFAEAKEHFPATKKLDLFNATFSNNVRKVDFILEKLDLGKEIKLENIFFKFREDEIPLEAKLELDRLGKFLQENTSIYIEVQGHTDNVGNDVYNLELSQRRAKSVADYLINKFKILDKRIKTVGLGETKPVASNDTEEGREKNRRVIFKIIKN